MTTRFVKMHGAGNDFVLIDDRDGRQESLLGRDAPRRVRILTALSARGTGVGCEGVIFVQPSVGADFRMRFFNPDGSEAELCGNGARCIAAFAREIGAASADVMRFETLAGTVEAEIVAPDLVRIRMPDPTGLRDDFVNSGVPHRIVPVEDLAGTDVDGEGRSIRFSADYAPSGTNVDFVRYRPPHAADIRTYERGVEAESGACGTGAVAVAVVGVARHGLSFPVRIRTVRNDELEVDGVFDGRSFSHMTLTGPVRRVFSGEIDLDSLDNIPK